MSGVNKYDTGWPSRLVFAVLSSMINIRSDRAYNCISLPGNTLPVFLE